MQESLCNVARDCFSGVLESRIVARMETEGRELTDIEVVKECEYLLETIDYAGYDGKYTSAVKRACKYVLKKWRM